ncbi:MAG: hypothetical protein WCI43_08090, partial [Candidatus Firestonebacteria bacterium]
MAGLAHKFISILHFDTFSKLLLTISVFFLISILIYIFWKKREQKALSLMLITATDENKSLNKINDLMLSSLSMVDVLNILINRISKDTKDSCANIFNLSEQREALLPFIVAASCRKEIESLNINKTDNPEIFESIFKKMNYEIPSHSKAGNL